MMQDGLVRWMRSPGGRPRYVRRPSPRLTYLGAPLLAAMITLAMLGCTKDSAVGPSNREVQAEPMGPHECGACGMVVREQPAPRGQVVHRDGTRQYFCSIGDLIQYISSPSPHGAAEHIFVETLAREAHPEVHDTRPHPWRDAQEAQYVLGVQRSGIMGPPVMVFATRDQAARTSAKFHGQQHSWSDLRGAVLSVAQRPQVQ